MYMLDLKSSLLKLINILFYFFWRVKSTFDELFLIIKFFSSNVMHTFRIIAKIMRNNNFFHKMEHAAQVVRRWNGSNKRN